MKEKPRKQYNYTRFYLSLNQEEGKILKDYLEKNYMSYTQFIRRIINEQILDTKKQK